MIMNRYPNISDHGLIGDLQTAALVTTDGTLDWFCCPRFDSPSVFASLLDADRGGFYRIAPDRDDYISKQLYLPDTAILVTRFMTPDGVGEVHDFMPVIEGAATSRHRLVRNIRVVRGVMRFAIEIQPRFDYSRKPHKLEISDHGVVFTSDDLQLTLHGIAPEGSSLAESGITPERAGDGLRWTRTLREGEIGGVVLESMGGMPRRVTPDEAQQLQDETERFWRGWLHLPSYNGR
jgi:GH15 family glucan-1,4-alpha-glucosidase